MRISDWSSDVCSSDLLRAAFPAGTVSGAPKIRALEIIRELEPVKRNVYSGAVGYLGWHGDADMSIAIRTAVIQGGRLHVQAGAGIRSEEHTSELQSLMRISYAVFCLNTKTITTTHYL